MDECATQVLQNNDSLEPDDPSSKEECIDGKIGTLVVDGKSYDIYPGDYVIGRDPSCAIVIDKKSVSSRHACIEAASAEDVLLYDLGSANKTRLGKVVLRPNVMYHLADSAQILFADTQATFYVKEGDDVVVPETPAHARPKTAFDWPKVAESPVVIVESPVADGESPTSDDSCIGPSPTSTPNLQHYRIGAMSVISPAVLVQRGSTTARKHLDLLEGNDEIFAAVAAGMSASEARKEKYVDLRRQSDEADMDDSDWIYDAETQKVSARVDNVADSNAELGDSIHDAETQKVSTRIKDSTNSENDRDESIYDAETQKVTALVADVTNSDADLSDSIYDTETQKVSTRIEDITNCENDLSDSIYDAETQKVTALVADVTNSDADLSDSIYDAETQKVSTRIEDNTNCENDLSDSIYDAKTQKVATRVENVTSSDNNVSDSILGAETRNISTYVDLSTNSDSSIYDAETQKVSPTRVENVTNSDNDVSDSIHDAMTQKVLPDKEDVTHDDDAPDWDKETASMEDDEGCDLQSVEQERPSNVEESDDDIHDRPTQKVSPNDEDIHDRPSNVEESDDDIHDRPTQKVSPNDEDDWDKETASLEDGEGCDLQSVEQDLPPLVEESDDDFHDQPTQKVSDFRNFKADSVRKKPVAEASRDVPLPGDDEDSTDADEDRESPSLLQDDEGKASPSLLQDYVDGDEDIGSPSLLQDADASPAPNTPAKSATTTKSVIADDAPDSDKSVTKKELRPVNGEEGGAMKGRDIVDAETVATAAREPAESVTPPEQVGAEADGGIERGTGPPVVTEENDQLRCRDPQTGSHEDVSDAETPVVCAKIKKVAKLDSQVDVDMAKTQVVCAKSKKGKLALSLDSQDDVYEAETRVTRATNKKIVKLAPSLGPDIHEAETQVDNIHDAETQVRSHNDNIHKAETQLETKDDNIHKAETQFETKDDNIHDAETQVFKQNGIHHAETQVHNTNDNINETETQAVKATNEKVAFVSSSAASDSDTFNAETRAGHPVAAPSTDDSLDSQDVGTRRRKRTTRRLPSSSDAETNGTEDAESNVLPVDDVYPKARQRGSFSDGKKASDLEPGKGRLVDDGNGPDEGGSYEVEEASTQPSEADTTRYNEPSLKCAARSLNDSLEDDIDLPSSQSLYNLLVSLGRMTPSRGLPSSPGPSSSPGTFSSPRPPPSPLLPLKRSRRPSKRLQEMESLFSSTGRFPRGKASKGGSRGKPSKAAADNEIDEEEVEEIPGVNDSPGPSSGKRQRHRGNAAAVDRSVKQAPVRKGAVKPNVAPVAVGGFDDGVALSDDPSGSEGATVGPQATDVSEESPVLVKRGRKPSKRVSGAGSLTLVRGTKKAPLEMGPTADSESVTGGEERKAKDGNVGVFVEPGSSSADTGKAVSGMKEKGKSGKKVAGLAVAAKGKTSSTVASSVLPSGKQPKLSEQVGSPEPTIDETSVKPAPKRAGQRDVTCSVKSTNDSWDESSLPMKRNRKPSRRMKDADRTFLKGSGKRTSTESQEEPVRAVERVPETKDEAMQNAVTVLEDNVGGVKGMVILAPGKTVKDKSRGRSSATVTKAEEIEEKSEMVSGKSKSFPSSEKRREKSTKVSTPVAAVDESQRVYSTRKKEAKPYAAWVAGKSPFVTSPPKRQKPPSKVRNASEPADVLIAAAQNAVGADEARVPSPAVVTAADVPATELPPSRRKANVGRPASASHTRQSQSATPADAQSIVEPVKALPSPKRKASKKSGVTVVEDLFKKVPPLKLVLRVPVEPLTVPSSRRAARKPATTVTENVVNDMPPPKLVTPKIEIPAQLASAALPSRRKNARKTAASLLDEPVKNLTSLKHITPKTDVEVETATASSKRKSAKKAPAAVVEVPAKSSPSRHAPTAPEVAVAPVKVPPSPKRKGARKSAAPAPHPLEVVEVSPDDSESVPSSPRKANKRSVVGGEPEEGLTPTKRRRGKQAEEEVEPPFVAQGKKRGRPTKVSGGIVAQSNTGAQLTPRRSARDCSKDTSHPRVLFTTTTSDIGDAAAILERLGGTSVDTPDECTVLVTNKVRRTYKFLCCMARGKPIVSPDWLRQSQQRGTFLDPWDFLVADAEAEQKFSFSLGAGLRRASESRLLEGYCVFVTPGVRPPPEEMRDIVLSCGGAWMARPPARWAQLSFAVTCAEDHRTWPALRGAPHVVSAELILLGVLRQRLDFEPHLIK